ncbi:MAG TPA: DUF2846 domain-containing protein [Guyparkeria sp.]|nr:DUF2846 domain-containing protein [Guyparkeria sp.]
MTRLYGLLTAVALLLLTGCASALTGQGDQAQDAAQAAEAFSPPPGKGSLYIFRDEVFGAAVPMRVSVNGHVLGQTRPNTYFWLTLDPGRYRIESQIENVSTVQVTVSAGENTFVWQEVKMGMWMARSLLQQVDAKRGRQGVIDAKWIKADLPEGGIRPLDGAAANESVEVSPGVERSGQQAVITVELSD